MPENRVNASISGENRTAIIAAIETIRDNLPFLLDLTPEERQTMLKLGDRSIVLMLGTGWQLKIRIFGSSHYL